MKGTCATKKISYIESNESIIADQSISYFPDEFSIQIPSKQSGNIFK